MRVCREIAILRLTPHFHREGSWPVAFDPVGGLQIQTFALTRGLDELGIAQTVATSHIPGSRRRQPFFERAELVSLGPWLPRFLAGPLLGLGWFLGILRMLATNKRRHDLIHIHYNHSVWCRILAILLSRTRLPVVVSLNTTLWGGLRQALRLEGSPLDVTLWIERLALKRVARVVALTEGAAHYVETKLHVPAGRIIVVPDAVAVDEFQAGLEQHAADIFRTRHDIPEDWRVVCYVGRISEEKGWRDLPEFVEAFSRRKVFLLICGDGPDRSKLERAFHRRRLGSGWAITGFVPPAEVRQTMQIAEVLILPSQREVFGSVLLEAMASGLPAVAYGVGGIVDVAGQPPAVSLARAGDPNDLLRRVFALLDDVGAAEELASRGRARVKNFAIERSVSLTGSLYQGMLCELRRRSFDCLSLPLK